MAVVLPTRRGKAADAADLHKYFAALEAARKHSGGSSDLPISTSASRLRAEAAEREVAELKLKLAAMKMGPSPMASVSSSGGLLASTSVSRLRAEAAERELAELKNQMAAKEAASARRRLEAARAFASKDAHLHEAMGRLAALKSREERASLDRAKDIKTIVLRAFQLDMVFLVDVTGSMQPSIDMVYNRISDIAASIIKQHPRTAIRAAFVGYRDYSDSKPIEKLDFVQLSNGNAAAGLATPASSAGIQQFKSFLQSIRCTGGADTAEDVFTGLEAVAGLSWSSQGSRLLVHVADAPCHGTEFHDPRVNDSYPTGDKHGRSIGSILQRLRTDCKVEVYYFAHLNDSTKVMLQRFKTAAGVSTWIQDELFSNLDALPEKIVILSVSSISAAFSAGVLGSGKGYATRLVRPERPNWSDPALRACKATAWHVKRYSAEDIVQLVRKKESLTHERFAEMTIKIAPYPFSGDGGCRWPYYAKVISDDTRSPISDFVVKRFKEPIGKPLSEVHRKSLYEEQMEVQSVCAALQREFNRQCRESRVRSRKVAFSQVSLLEVQLAAGSPMYYNIEKELKGEFIKYSNNAGYVNTKDYQATLQAFSHWTYDFSGGALMVTDLQGILDRGEGMFWLCDPAVHSSVDLLRFGKTNLGDDGYRLYFESHTCNAICRRLGLKRHPCQPTGAAAAGGGGAAAHSLASCGSSRPGSAVRAASSSAGSGWAASVGSAASGRRRDDCVIM